MVAVVSPVHGPVTAVKASMHAASEGHTIHIMCVASAVASILVVGHTAVVTYAISDPHLVALVAAVRGVMPSMHPMMTAMLLMV